MKEDDSIASRMDRSGISLQAQDFSLKDIPDLRNYVLSVRAGDEKRALWFRCNYTGDPDSSTVRKQFATVGKELILKGRIVQYWNLLTAVGRLNDNAHALDDIPHLLIGGFYTGGMGNPLTEREIYNLTETIKLRAGFGRYTHLCTERGARYNDVSEWYGDDFMSWMLKECMIYTYSGATE